MGNVPLSQSDDILLCLTRGRIHKYDGKSICYSHSVPLSESVTSLQLLKNEMITSNLLRKNNLPRRSAFLAPFVSCKYKASNMTNFNRIRNFSQLRKHKTRNVLVADERLSLPEVPVHLVQYQTSNRAGQSELVQRP